MSQLEYDMTYFFACFLPMNTVHSGSYLFQGQLEDMMHVTPDLRDALCAVAALHRSRLAQSTTATGKHPEPPDVALQLYGRSVKSINRRIMCNTFAGDCSMLWTTFFLGLFELMCDPTGNNWLAHFLHGTCAILRLLQPSSLACKDQHSTYTRTFFLTTRIFEISRALIYSEPTFLSEAVWANALARFWSGEGAAVWHPKESLFDMLPSVSELSIRALRFCSFEAVSMSDQMQLQRAQDLGAEGLLLRQMLQEWWEMSNTWQHTSQELILDSELLLGHVYYHAISIYHSGTYDYHMHWTQPGSPDAPILAQSEIDWHTREILRLSRELLACGVAGVLLFFPLRVAGARVQSSREREDILDLLYVVVQRGYVVGDAITSDLAEFWECSRVP
ncbi:Fungal-trans-2 domain containing protein [Pyrenophora tritici-repentis]|uniref:Fungal specific transcription factor domain containing protein n=2 Tax=Pyrenophora tritici-repentis TaxID=45151 RepID=A0A2W1E7Z2_9PLEO|nr:uncharacterized protein PTRG_00013 [Pyrenophora tritici-repentis Pt-1C-BFP]KAA8624575.1 Fungal-trans-2 domain-containing protein [Pyrenophora tritici-repentis]EDU39451.1 conserved hypothetical protein [Pyrenophora tritici-repentis Pt-1C-BFP]KAF7452973.1 Fungal-trans-2 domain containing protein [Pyrenophora tritici-repentis]KAF7576020.1 Fungal-trans-2 domain containing protein [Pyrenophora tritici-repentis]KAG9377576.1 hypothetical protein A1F94_011979 [Pyrenophora tritici-repentis]